MQMNSPQASVALPGAASCPYCNKIYVNADVLATHVNKCKTKKHVCPVCGLRCLVPAHLRKHMASVHPEFGNK